MSEQEQQPIQPGQPVQDFGLQCIIEVNRYPSGERVGRFLHTVIPFDFFIMNQVPYDVTLNTYLNSAVHDCKEAVTVQSRNGYKGWPLLKKLFDQLSKSQLGKETPPTPNKEGEEWKDEQ